MRRYGVAPRGRLLSHATSGRDQRPSRGKRRTRSVDHHGAAFRDVLELRRSARADLYDLFQTRRQPLIPRRRRFELTERVGADGAIVNAARENEIDALIAVLKIARVEAIAVAFLFSFLNPEHERRLGTVLRAALPDVPVYLSSDVLAGDQGVRAHQHDRHLRLCRAGFLAS